MAAQTCYNRAKEHPLPIRILPTEVAARIAAGEVVERPASVVKELVENALDAGATLISIEISGGGIESIRVADDGCGIEPDEIETAFRRHATSKLDNDVDLARILTLGFRGEALPSIAAVAEVEMISRPHDREAAASIQLVPDATPVMAARGAPGGTTIAVRRLFGRLPARRKFLRSPSAESSAVAAVVTHYALSYPEVRFSLTLDGRRSLQTAGSGDLRDAVSAVYGAELASVMVELQSPGAPISVRGLAAPPHISRAGRGYVSIFVNRRWVQNRRLAFAVEEAYQGLLMTGRRPIAVLNLRMAYEEVDVNVHPTKAEVRFRDESAVFGALRQAVRGALREFAPVAPASFGVGAGALAVQPTMPPLWRQALSGVAVATIERPGAQEPSGPLATPQTALPVLRVIGQFGSIYIIAEGPEGMYLIDQHAAHERVLYDRYCRMRTERTPEVQALLEPVALDITARHLGLIVSESEALAAHGFEIEPFGDGAALLRALPVALAVEDTHEAALRFLDALLEGEEGDPSAGLGTGPVIAPERDRVAMSLACHGAVRAGKTLSVDEMRELVRQLEETGSPHTCPHGRPTMVHMSGDMLARGFGRR